MRKAQGKGFFRGLYKVAEFITFFCLCLFFLIGAGRCATAKYVYPVKYKTEVFAYADMYGLSRALVFAMIKTESGFDPSARSDAGAVGLMQITEETGKYIAEKLGAKVTVAHHRFAYHTKVGLYQLYNFVLWAYLQRRYLIELVRQSL